MPDRKEIEGLLERVKRGGLSPAKAADAIFGYSDLSFARVDCDRAGRCGFGEVIYCEGKTPVQTAKIAKKILVGGGNLLATRADRKHFDAVKKAAPKAVYHGDARCITVRREKKKPPPGYAAVLCAGTSDVPVAEEARVTLEIMDIDVVTFYDVGVAGVHRLYRHREKIDGAAVIVAVAGMEGALPSVVGGMTRRPVIAVPTSTGYGTAFGGVTALLGMLNSCSSGVTVVNIDNGFGAGYSAALIARLTEKSET